jgi:wyosine [tRNA(Phe)-imidazoG37] synthetase (radical SAM superfamily)
MNIVWEISEIRLDWGNIYRAIHALCDEMGNIWEENHEQFYAILFRLLRLHKEFYRIAVFILLSEGTEREYIKEYQDAIRQEQIKFIEILRWMKVPESLRQRLFRNRRIHGIVWFLENLMSDIFTDWKIEEWTQELIYYPDD